MFRELEWNKKKNKYIKNWQIFLSKVQHPPQHKQDMRFFILKIIRYFLNMFSKGFYLKKFLSIVFYEKNFFTELFYHTFSGENIFSPKLWLKKWHKKHFIKNRLTFFWRDTVFFLLLSFKKCFQPSKITSASKWSRKLNTY